MKVIFLDVDGVLNTGEGWDTINDDCVKRLKQVVDLTGALLVLSSSWQDDLDLCKVLENKLLEHNISKWIATTGDDKLVSERAIAIRDWLSARKVERFAIIDDDDDAKEFGLHFHFFQTEFNTGLTDEIANAVVAHLNTPA